MNDGLPESVLEDAIRKGVAIFRGDIKQVVVGTQIPEVEVLHELLVALKLCREVLVLEIQHHVLVLVHERLVAMHLVYAPLEQYLVLNDRGLGELEQVPHVDQGSIDLIQVLENFIELVLDLQLKNVFGDRVRDSHQQQNESYQYLAPSRLIPILLVP